ncbi:MAG: NADPH-dependent F420 reductase [Actinomycetota bacterium]|nr:NADPH-dependent F420 reductase [Actinomycetota bacterium]
MRVGILGATGPAGQAMAARVASVGVEVVVGSRSAQRAADACEALNKQWPDLDLPLTPGTNDEAAGAELVIVATPWDAAAATAASVGDHLGGKVVISMANGIANADGELLPVAPPQGSVAVAVQEAVPDALVAAAFHHLPARSVADLSRTVEGDVLICADRPEAADATAELVVRIPVLRPLHAGSLALAAPVEAFTAVLLGLNRRHKARASLRIAGIPRHTPDPGG